MTSLDWQDRARAVAAIVAYPDEKHGAIVGRNWPDPTPVAILGDDTQPDMSWSDGSGNCVGLDPDLFFPERGASSRDAVNICLTGPCPLLEPCREHGLHHEHAGIWGALSERQRRVERRARGIVVVKARSPQAKRSEP